jgi:hypothetical protein
LIDPQANKCGEFPGGAANPPTLKSKSKTFVLSANTTKTFDVGYPAALTSASNARHYCQAHVSGRGRRFVKILSRRSLRGGIEGPRLELLRAGTVWRVKAHDNANRRSRDTSARIKVTATTA